MGLNYASIHKRLLFSEEVSWDQALGVTETEADSRGQSPTYTQIDREAPFRKT